MSFEALPSTSLNASSPKSSNGLHGCNKMCETSLANVARRTYYERRQRIIFRIDNQGHRREIFIGGGVGFIGTQTHVPPKFSFSSDFGHFILKKLEKKLYASRKKILKYPNFCGGRHPRFSKVLGLRPPRLPIGDALVDNTYSKETVQLSSKAQCGVCLAEHLP